MSNGIWRVIQLTTLVETGARAMLGAVFGAAATSELDRAQAAAAAAGDPSP